MARKFKFISPGVFLNEIDNSQLPNEPQAVGPLVIGNTRKGPAMRPVRVESFAEFVDIFGQPTAGNDGTDVWRSGEPQAPTYAAYAAQAWLKNSPTINIVRLLGTEHKNRTAATSNNRPFARRSRHTANTSHRLISSNLVFEWRLYWSRWNKCSGHWFSSRRRRSDSLNWYADAV